MLVAENCSTVDTPGDKALVWWQSPGAASYTVTMSNYVSRVHGFKHGIILHFAEGVIRLDFFGKKALWVHRKYDLTYDKLIYKEHGQR